MKFFKQLGLLFIICTPCFGATGASAIYHSVFWNPDINNVPLAYCHIDGISCGKVVADEFCCQMGYEKSTKYDIAHNIGMTHFIDAPVRCTGWQCDGFKNIRCEARVRHHPPGKWHYRYQKFVYPRFDNYRVDWCYDGKTRCGHRAAESFCRRIGFYKVKSYKKQVEVAATKAIGNQKLCFQEACSGFSYISCER